jgi:hypothetical protein
LPLLRPWPTKRKSNTKKGVEKETIIETEVTFEVEVEVDHVDMIETKDRLLWQTLVLQQQLLPIGIIRSAVSVTVTGTSEVVTALVEVAEATMIAEVVLEAEAAALIVVLVILETSFLAVLVVLPMICHEHHAPVPRWVVLSLVARNWTVC